MLLLLLLKMLMVMLWVVSVEKRAWKRERQEFKKQAREMAQADLLVSQVREMTRAVRDQVTVERQQNLKTSIRFSKRHWRDMKTILRFYETDVRNKSQYFIKWVDDNDN